MQAAADDGSMVWSPVNHVPHRDLNVRSAFVELSTGNGTALTLSGSHMVYTANAASARRIPAPARDVKARSS